MRLTSILPVAVFLSLAIALPAKAGRYYPECLSTNETLVEWDGDAVICQSKLDKDKWSRYEFTEGSDGMYYYSLMITVNTYFSEYSDPLDSISTQVPGVISSRFDLESDGSMTSYDDNIQFAFSHVDKINALLDTRLSYIGY